MKKILDTIYHPQLVESMIKRSIPNIYLSGIILPLIVSIITYEYVGSINIILWLFLNVVVLALRVFNLKKIRQKIEKNENFVWNINVIIFLVFLSGLIYALELIYMSYFVPPMELLFMAILMIALVAGAFPSLIGIYFAFVIYVLVNTLSIVYVFLLHGGDIFAIFAFVTLIFTFMMLKNGYIHYESLLENIFLKETFDTFEKRVNESTRELQSKNEKLNASLKNFHELLDSSMVMIVFYTETGNIVELNKEAVAIFGYDSKEKAIGTNIKVCIPKSSWKTIEKALQDKNSVPYEITVEKLDGTKFLVLINGKMIMLNSQKVRMLTMMDVTEAKEKDHLLQRQAKLAQMGEMLSMIAHQWRQPLSAISAASASLTIRSELNTLDKSTVLQIASDIASYSQHLSDTIDDFRNFFKPNKSLEFVDFCKLTHSVLSIVEKPIENKNIKLILELKCEEKFLSYPNELKQVILNLIQNAQDALIEKKIKEPYIKIVTGINKKNILPYSIRVYDNAGGIEDDVIEKIFEPYFSTKLEKNGSGLGLYMSKTIVEEHCDGRLSVTNTNDGACFSIEIAGKEI